MVHCTTAAINILLHHCMCHCQQNSDTTTPTPAKRHDHGSGAREKRCMYGRKNCKHHPRKKLALHTYQKAQADRIQRRRRISRCEKCAKAKAVLAAKKKSRHNNYDEKTHSKYKAYHDACQIGPVPLYWAIHLFTRPYCLLLSWAFCTFGSVCM